MKYIANPVEVEAFRITEIGIRHEYFGTRLVLDGGPWYATATPEMMSRMVPQVGDYWVVQSDGYTYLNPKDVFERKYSPVSFGGS